LNPNQPGDRIRSSALEEGWPSVLVVEDDPSLRLLCRVNLELEEFNVREAGTIDAARAAINEGRPDVVLLDVHLDGVPSDDLLAELRTSGIPVVVVTGSVDLEQYRDRADDVLGKPFAPSDLVAAARRLSVR
jgi:DNA-binding response OmpR family regulator